MKIIRTDNYGRDFISDELVAENISNEVEGSYMVEALNEKTKGDSSYYRLVSDDYKLYKFEP